MIPTISLLKLQGRAGTGPGCLRGGEARDKVLVGRGC
jgi:hypothetical protein